MKTAVAFLVLLQALVSSASASQETFALKRKFTSGETDRYTTVVKFENGTEAVMTTTEVTREVRDDGSVLVATTVDSIVLRARGSEMAFPGGSGQVVLTTYDKTGKPIRQESRGGQGNVGQLLNVARPSLFLDRSLKVGETVRDEAPTGSDKTGKAVVQITLLGIDKKGADLPVDCLRFKVVTDSSTPGPSGEVKTRSEVTLRLSQAEGKLISAEGQIDGIPTPAGPTKLSYKVTRVADKPKAGS